MANRGFTGPNGLGGFLPAPYSGGWDSSPAGGHYDGVNDGDKPQVLDRPKYAFIKKRLPTVGVGNYAFATRELVKRSLAGRGTATRGQRQYHTIQPQQVYIQGQALKVQGLGGLVAGQIIFQPLVNPYNNTVG